MTSPLSLSGHSAPPPGYVLLCRGILPAAVLSHVSSPPRPAWSDFASPALPPSAGLPLVSRAEQPLTTSPGAEREASSSPLPLLRWLHLRNNTENKETHLILSI